MALEQSLHHDSKQKGGLIGISHNDSSIAIWTSIAHLRSQVWINVEMSNYINFTKDLISSGIAKSESEASASSLIQIFCKIPLRYVKYLYRMLSLD